MSGTLYDLKPRFQALLRPGVARLAAAGVTANQVTIATLAVSVAAGGFVAWRADERWPFLLLPVWLFLRMAMNAVDGMLAREHGQRSALGAYLNELCDVLADTALTVPFALVAPFGWAGVGSVVVLAIVSEMAGALGPMVGAPRRYDGPMGKSDRAFVFGALGLWIGAGGATPSWLAWAMPAIAAAIAWNIVNRVRAGVAHARDAVR
ncbi:MAG: CDP-alcohol phosphatidyltransferase family protein [Burkholderiales bacterium]|nr:CDP-alcohol phosphatidyltransferase family protein [Burkholderiales bacterium]MCC7113462.1 CDP-alcohol phosphatidyltransferase family protein [Burkholderiales bacterium]